MVALISAVTVGLSVSSDANASSPTPQIPGSPAAPTAEQIDPVCTTTTPGSALGPATVLPGNPTSTVVTPTGGVQNFAATATNLYVDTGTQLITYTLAGIEVSSFALPSTFGNADEVYQPVVDPSGNIYLSSYYGTAVDKFSPTGTLLWSVDPQSGNPNAIFPVGSGADFQVAVSLAQDTSSSLLLDPTTGAANGTFPLVVSQSSYVTQEAGGDYLLAANGYVETLSAAGQLLSTFGAPNIEGNDQHTGSGTQFYYQGQAVPGPDGTIYTADPLYTMQATAPNGILQGSTTLGGALDFGGWGFALEGSTFYYQSGAPFNGAADSISSFSLASVQTFMSAIQAPSNSLGWGAGLATTATGNYFPSDTTPTVNATFDPWWISDASNLELSYSVENTTSLDAETVPTPTVIPLPTTAAGLATIPLTLTSADTQPGPYQVQAQLLNTSTTPATTLGTTCMPYTVGAPGDGLDFATLPSGIGSGGPADPRGVALTSQLGLSGSRSLTTINWPSLLPQCNASAPTAATCGPSAITFASASEQPYQAAYLADQDHVTYWIQVSGGEPMAVALVDSGLWQGDVTALVSHYATVPAGCANCAPVTNWEPWNESNNTGWPNGATYTTQVLAPFYAAVKSVEPGSESIVIGGTTLGLVTSWWQQLVNAGGLADMDVAAVHPYPGSNDSYEEDGIPAQVRQIQAIIGSKPLWFTEIGWWSDGDYNFLAQANNMARSLIWQKVLGVPVENYFFDEGSWGNDGVSFSLIQASLSDDYVKPAALATMTASGALAGRPYVSMPNIGIPQGYQADFGPTSGGSTDMAAVWTDGLPVTATVTLTDPNGTTDPVTVTNEYGGTTTVQAASGTAYSLPLSDQVQYLTYPAGDTLTVGPTETYGTNLASAAAGATAAASSGNASAAIEGLPTGYGLGWSSAAGDTTPSITVTLAGASTLDRVIVDTQSVGSTATSIREYTLSADEPGIGWVNIGNMPAQYRDHEALFTFAPLVATALQINVSEVNFGGYYGGGIPPFWPATQGATAFIHTIEAYSGSGGPSVVNGTALPALLGGSSGGGTGSGTTTTTTTDPPTTTTTVPPTTTTTTVPPTTTTTTSPANGPPPTTSTTTTTTDPPTTTTTTTTDPPPTTTTTTDPPPTTTTTTTTDPPPTTTTDPPPTTTTTTDPPSTTTTTTDPPTQGSTASGNTSQTGVNRLKGYWLTTSNGGIFSFGDAPALGSASGMALNKPIVGMTSTPDRQGYWMVASDGGIFNFGDAGFFGSTGGMTLNKPIVGIASTPDGQGYWLVASDGGIFAFGDASFYGSTGGMTLNKPIVGMAATPDGKGYWLVASDGGIFAFGDASFYGSTGGMTLNKPIVGMAATPDGKGYWLVASDGGIFAFGDASFYGSTGGMTLNKPIVGMAATPDGKGYWLVASDGGIFAFGDASFYGSTGGMTLNKPIVGMSANFDGGGYWLAASDGGIFAFGDAGYFGSTGAIHLNAPITGMQASPTGDGYWLVSQDGGIFAFGDAHYYGSAGNMHLTHPAIAIT